ncbi:hypothetical protein KSP40_PGU008527 [Platanthera guangdongensis]|uniref:Sas10 C-terminal domain-containing protein n=1 Tax=Platanthera guangdongensis TaxID=2320717 RepID=A0ABR2LJ08_9ASPA
MGRISNKRRRTPKARKAHALDDDACLDNGIDDEIDSFHKQREMIPLDVNKDSEDSDDDVEEPVFDLEAYQNGRDDDEEDDMDDGEFTDVKDKGFAAKIARQAKYLKERFGGEDEISDDDKSDEERRTSWGRKKNMYYGADNIDYELQSSDEDLLMEEAEVLKIERERAKTLIKSDFGLETSDEEEDRSVGEKTFQDLAKERATTKRGANVVDGLTHDSEVIKKNLNALSKKEKMDLVHRSAPELVGLLSEMKMAYNEFKKMKPLVSVDFKLGEGSNYFEVKYMTSLLYCLVISAYLILKSEGHSIRDHPVIACILETKILWDKLMKMSWKFPLPVGNSINHNHESITKSNVEISSLQREACLVDMPTKALTVPEMAGFSKDVSKNPDRKIASKKQQKPQLDQKRIEMMKIRKNLEAKLKKNSSYGGLKLVADKTEKVLARPISGNLVTLDDFDDEPIHSKHHGSASRHLSLNKLTQTAGTKKNGWKIISGDEDLPKRDDIAERRRKYELRVLAGAGLTNDGGEGFGRSQGINKAGTNLQESGKIESEDESDREVKKQRINKAGKSLQESGKIESEDESDREVKIQRAEKLPTKAKTPQHVLEEEPAFNGRRLIPREIEKNRGLTRYRKKLTKNPRKKYKIKHEKAVMRRKGQVRDIRRPTGSYGGEPTGININVSRSIRFKN